MKRYYIILFLFTALSAISQPPSKFYNKFGGFGVDIGYSVKETFDRQYIIAGSTSSSGNGEVDAHLLLLDSMGKVKWGKNFGGVYNDVAKSLVINPIDSGFIFVGQTNSFGNGGYDVYLVRTDKNGNLKWQNTYGGIDWDFGNDLTFAPDGNLLICGNSYSSSYGKNDGYLLKVNILNGNLIWSKHYGGKEEDDFRSLKVTFDNKIILTGKTNSYNDLKGDIYFFKTDINGDSLLYKSYGLVNKEDYGNELLDDYPLYYVIAGGTESYSSGMKDAFVMKTNLNGDSLWLRKYGNSTNDQECTNLIFTKNYQGRYGFSYSDIDIAFYKRNPKNIALDMNGLDIFTYAFGETEDEELYDVSNTSDKGYIGVGYTKSFGAILEDIYVIKYDSVFMFGGNLIGIKEIKVTNGRFKIYPTILYEKNNNITIEGEGNYAFSLLDIYSRELLKGVQSDDPTIKQNVLNLPDLISGIYFLKITKDLQVFYLKIIKN